MMTGIYVVGIRANRALALGPYAPDDAFGKERGANWLATADYCSVVYHVEASNLEEAKSRAWKEHDNQAAVR